MKKIFATAVLALAMLFGTAAANACTNILPTNVNGIGWQYCPEVSQYAIGNFGPATIQVEYRVVFTNGTFADGTVTLGPGQYWHENVAAPVANVVILNYQIL